jgi:stage II sporulation protein AA (anti-sigma F factor antagonist)
MTGEGNNRSIRGSPLAIEAVTTDTTTMLMIRGELDVATVRQLQDALAASDGDNVDLDLSALEFIDASGVGMLARAAAQYRQGGKGLRVLRARPFVQRVLAVCELDHLIGSSDGDGSSTKASDSKSH